MRKIVETTINLLVEQLNQKTVDELFLLRLFDSPAEMRYIFRQIHFTKTRLEEEIKDCDKALAENNVEGEEILELLRDRMQIALDKLNAEETEDKGEKL